MTKNFVFLDRTAETILTTSKFENGNSKNIVDMWPEYGFFKQQPCEFGEFSEELSRELHYLYQPGISIG